METKKKSLSLAEIKALAGDQPSAGGGSDFYALSWAKVGAKNMLFLRSVGRFKRYAGGRFADVTREEAQAELEEEASRIATGEQQRPEYGRALYPLFTFEGSAKELELPTEEDDKYFADAKYVAWRLNWPPMDWQEGHQYAVSFDRKKPSKNKDPKTGKTWSYNVPKVVDLTAKGIEWNGSKK